MISSCCFLRLITTCITWMLFINTVIKIVDGSHFRGGIFMWKPTSNENEVTITFRVAWRRTYSSLTRCDKATVTEGNVIANLGSVSCYGCPSGSTISNVGIVCTDFSLQEDWTQGERSFNYTFQNKTAQFGFTGTAWISLVSGGGRWEMRTTVDLNRRRDTGKINSSPESAMPPIIRLQHGCDHNITIPVYDKDNDTVRCRWSESSKSECGGVCKSFPNSFLDEKRCEISYIAKYQTGWFAVAIQIEDFSTLNTTKALSSVSLQFLVNVFASNVPCQDKPKFIMPTRLNGACVGIPVSSTWTEQIIARSGADGVNITEITTVSPPGLKTSDLQKYGSSNRESYVNTTWTPLPSQTGEKTFCYTASDTDSLVSEKICIKLLVGVEPPKIQSYGPLGDIIPSQEYFYVHFNIQFVKPSQRAFVYFYKRNHHLVSKLDLSQNDKDIYPLHADNSGNWVLKISKNFELEEKEYYYIRLDPGIAKGVIGCGAESSALWDPNDWTFRVRDVTPPVLTFCSCNPSVTGTHIVIKWLFDEPVLYVNCTLQNGTQFVPVQCDKTSWRSGDFNEGFYTLFVQGTDFENNTANQKPYTWFVDKTAPTLTIMTTPPKLSNQRTAVFDMRCNEPCRISCSLDPKTSPSALTLCSTQLKKHHIIKKSNLISDTLYIFQALGVDESGNIGETLLYEFKTDFQLPSIEQLPDISVECQKGLNLNATRTPKATDNSGIANLTHSDIMLQNCQVKRTWTAFDIAGNKNAFTQIISVVSSSSPAVAFPPDVAIACGSLSQITDDVLKPSVRVYHPCGLQVKVTYSDPFEIENGCGFTFVRNWTVEDNCRHTIIGFQQIQIMDPQDPNTPERGEETDLSPLLSWPESLKTAKYRLFLWDASRSRPTVHTYFGSNTWFQSSNLHQGLMYFWQVEVVVNANITQYSPRWNFKTKSYIDLSIIEVTIPPLAHSGQSFQIRWIVQNIGKAPTSFYEYWYDQVFLGFTDDINSARRISTIHQRKIVAENDTYQGLAEVTLRDDDIGTAFIFVRVDVYRYLDDFDRSNNFLRSQKTVTVQFTPPPDLIVEKIDLPSGTFSGQVIQIQYTISNIGQGPTKSKRWIDSIYWSKDSTYDESDEHVLSTTRNGVLLAGESYRLKQHVKIPQNIFGVFHIIVKTDRNRNVFEYTAEDNNWLASEPLDVTLSPPPDLNVADVKIRNPKPSFSTGEIIHLQWRVTNEGSRKPDVSIWIDTVVLVDHLNWRMTLEEANIYHTVLPNEHYTEAISYLINPTILSGNYNVCVITDGNEQVFEYGTRENNMQCIPLTISQSLSDLEVRELSVNLYIDDLGYNALNVSWTVQNIGSGPTITPAWTDIVVLQDVDVAKAKHNFPVRKVVLNPNEMYTKAMSLVLNEKIHGRVSVFLNTDAFDNVYEFNEINNEYRKEISVPLRTPNLEIMAFNVLNESLFSGDTMYITWTAITTSVAISDQFVWTDILKVKFEPNDLMIKTFARKAKGPLLLSGSYTSTVKVQVPYNFIGFVHMNLAINSRGDVFEGNGVLDNSRSISVKVLSPSSPDLVITKLHSYLISKQSRLAVIIWTVKNIGNSMKEKKEWVDEVSLQTTGSLSRNISLTTYKQIWSLETGAEYMVNKTVVIPSTIVGQFYVNLTTDSNNNIQEINGETNNWKRSENSIFFPELPKIDLKAVVISKGTCSVDDLDTFCISYTVTNDGEISTAKSSWNDGIFMCNSNAKNSQELTKFAVNNHIGGLSPGESYSENTSVPLPSKISDEPYYILIVPDYTESSHSLTIDCSAAHENLPIKDLIEYQARMFCSNLQVTLTTKAQTITAGDVINVEYNISNSGNCGLKKLFYVALFLSTSIDNDPFERKIKTSLVSDPIPRNGTISASSIVQLPIDMESRDYFIVVQVDSRHDIIELNENDNVAISVIKIRQNIHTDIVVFNVTAPEEVEYGEKFTVQWSIMNNGSEDAKGYKCDSFYLSQDSRWDVTDEILGKMQCSKFSIGQITSGGIVNTYSAALPALASLSYRTIVKTRTNFREYDQTNNIGISQNSTLVRYPICFLGQNTSFSITLNEQKIFRIPDVPAARTIIIKTTSADPLAFHELYVKQYTAPSEYSFDYSVEDPFQSEQAIVVTNTGGGDYYVLVKTSGSTFINNNPVFLSLLPKIAKFEVTDCFPKSAASHGNITLKIAGTLLPEKFSASLFNSSFSIKSSKRYWFSSSSVAATFNANHLRKGSSYSLNLTDNGSQKTSIFRNALTVISGRDGYVKVEVSMPETLFLGQTDVMHIDVRNAGDNDLMSPLIHIEATGGQLKYIHEFHENDWTEGITIVSGSLDGPGGVLLPSETSRLQFQIRSATPNLPNDMKVVASQVKNLNSKHSYVNMKSVLRPTSIQEDVWDPIWENFMELVGESWLSLQRKVSELMNEISAFGQRQYNLETVIKYILDIAEGLGDKQYTVSAFDFGSEYDGTFSEIVRLYPRRIGLRRSSGPFGRGWIMPLWETYLIGIDEAVAILYWKREEVIFTAYGIGMYRNEERGNLTLSFQDTIFFSDPETGDQYHFNFTTGKILYVLHENDIIKFVYDSSDRISSLHSAGKDTVIEYNENGNIAVIRKRDNSTNIIETCSYGYNERNCLSTVYCGNQTVSYEYRENGDLLTIHESTTVRRVFQYTDNHLLRSEEYFKDGNFISKKIYDDYQNSRIDVTYIPERNRISYWIGPEGKVMGHKRNGYPVSKTLRKQNVEEQLEGDMVVKKVLTNGEIVEIQDANGDSMGFLENDDGYRIIFVDGNLNSYYIFRSLNNSIHTIIYPDNTNETYVSLEETIVHKDQSGREVTYHYDKSRRLALRTTDSNFLLFKYTGDDRIKSIANSHSRFTFKYDEMGQVSDFTDEDNNVTISQTIDDSELLRNLRIESDPYDLVYNYNIHGKITSVKNRSDGKIIATILYYENGLMKRKTLGNNATTYYEYYETTKRLKVLSNFFPNGTISSVFRYSYDKRGQLESVQTPQGTWNFSYDLSGQLTVLEDPSNAETLIQYDQNKNRISFTQNGISKLSQINSLNQYVSFDGKQYTYDKNGNLISKTNLTVEYDEDNRVSRFVAGSMTCQLQYSALGHLQRKMCDNSSSTYLTDLSGNILKQVDDTKGTVTYHIYADGIGLIATKENGVYLYYQYDVLGSVMDMLDEQGNSVDSFKFDPFGNTLDTSKRNQDNFRYLGQWGAVSFNEMPNIYFLGSRLYDSSIGRFLGINREGIFCQQPNFYIFKGNNPLNLDLAHSFNEDLRCSLKELDAETIVNHSHRKTVRALSNKNKEITKSKRKKRNVDKNEPKAPQTANSNKKENVKNRPKRKGFNEGNGLKDIVNEYFNLDERLKDLSDCEKHLINKGIDKVLDFVQKGVKKSAYGRVAMGIIDVGGFLYKHRKCIMSPCDCLDNAIQKYHDTKDKIDQLLNDPNARQDAINNYCDNKYNPPCRIVDSWSSVACKATGKIVNSQFHHFKDGLQNMYDKVKPYTDKLDNALDAASKACDDPSKLGDGLTQWIGSIDPNDILGPPGYGAAKCISSKTEMVYKIRFENLENATAPAQRVYIEISFHPKLNSRTFRLGSFGFGQFTEELSFKQSFMQEKVNLTTEYGVYVYVQCGLDIINNKATWEFQAINASTGLPPSDPSVGFLPPNNGTTGQGFVTFSIRTSSDVKSLDKITAKAAIIFDQNEPIDTPEIFNTIDDTPPYVRNISVNIEAMSRGSLILNLDVKDDGSGLEYVDILYADSDVLLLMSGVQENAVSLPLEPDTNYTIILQPVDKIGNSGTLQNISPSNIYTFFYPKPEVRCDDLNNCSGNGHCEGLNFCSCFDGFFGRDCIKNSPPLDPPLLDVFSGDQRDTTVPLYLSSQLVTDIKDAEITIQCKGFPDQSLFSVGTVVGDTLHVRAADFGDLLYMPPVGYTGSFSLRITSFLSITDSSEKSTRETAIPLIVKHSVSGADRKNFERTYFGSGSTVTDDAPRISAGITLCTILLAATVILQLDD